MKMPPAFSEENNLYAIIETPKGSRNKYTFEKKTGLYFLKKILPAGLSFPLDFGFIPNTKAEDEDPMDVLVFMEQPAFPGIVLECRVIGIITAEQEKNTKLIRNDRVLSVAVESKEYETLRNIHDVGKEYLRNIGKFFETYHQLEGSPWMVKQIADADEAIRLIKKNME
jgi:inorganic pyrophosphatase